MQLKSNRNILIGIGVAVILIVIYLIYNNNLNGMSGMDHSKMSSDQMNAMNSNQAPSNVKTTKMEIADGKNFTLTAQASHLEVQDGKTLSVWTFNNSVPGPQIRVKQGDTVKVTLNNSLPEPVSIHWHGYPVPFDMDGIPGMTQNAVQPGKSFTYEFKATTPGTYWYHSHQDSVNQVDRGLYGSFIVVPQDDIIDKDYTLVLDEWVSSETMGTMDMSNMDHSKMSMGDNMSMVDNMSMYDLYTMNGKTGSAIDKLSVMKGDKVRIRLINAGFISHQMHLHGQDFKVTATDGQPVNNPQTLKDTLISIAPGERYDIEFAANNPGQWYLEEHGKEPRVKGMKTMIQYEGDNTIADQPNDSVTLPVFDLTKYGQPSKPAFNLDQKFDVEYTMKLNTEQKGGNIAYTINGKTFPDTVPVKVKKGDIVKVTFVNESKNADHPMHLHGQFFEVLSKNGQLLEGTSIVKDTLNIKPGEQYVVAFKADNPGDWMFHCHDLHHAAAGMVTELQYTDFNNTFVSDPKAGNKPE
ncbi:MAG: multicopper oxidase family protein [Paenibacillaceae bacterium]